jgi:hypothetical protein
MRRRILVGSALVAAAWFGACGHAEDIGKDRPPPSRLVGLACIDNTDCEQYCARWGHNFPGGFCTLQGCRRLEDCPSGTVCIATDGGVCVYPCAGPRDCTSDFLGRPGYTCKFMYGYNDGDTTASQYEVCVGN